MKKQYKILLSIIIIEIFIIAELNLNIQLWFGKTIGACVFFLPVEILLFKIGRDESFSKRKRMCAKAIFFHIIVCCLLSGIASIISLIIK